MRPALLPFASAFLLALASACQPTPPAEPAASPASVPEARLRYLDGSTTKVEQLIGDIDNQTKLPTTNQTLSRYHIRGTDLGNSFQHNGKTYFLFGDTIGPWGGDVIGVSTSTNPDQPLALDFLTGWDGTYLRVEPPGIAMGGNEIPVGGISLDGAIYLAIRTNWQPGGLSEFSVLVRYDEARRSFHVIRELSRLPNGRFITTTMRVAPSGMEGLPGPGRWVLMFGSGRYRSSNGYLAAIPAETFGTTGEGTYYFSGMDGRRPTWTLEQDQAWPIIVHNTIGDISVSYISEIDTWVTIYDSRNPRGVVLSYAPQPWGPWSAPHAIFDQVRDQAYGAYIHAPNLGYDDGLGGPVIGERDAFRTTGGIYAPYIIEPFTRIDGDKLTLHYVMSTWNPYVVVRMRSTLTIEGLGLKPVQAQIQRELLSGIW